MADNWLWATAAELGRGIGAGEIDPVELTEAYLEAARTHPQAEKTYARLTPERASAESLAARDRAKAGLRRGPLDGVPISWKDLYDTAGVATEAGSAMLSGRVPDADAKCLADATHQGLVCLGKTHMTELAFSGLGYNPVTATPPCVNDMEAVPGGSSSGAATSVAFGMAAAGIGSDTGGSVRIPSAWNDLVGLKTTHGLISLQGVVPLCENFDTVGPLCRSVEDAALLLEAMTGTRTDLDGADLSGRRFAVCTTVALDDLEESCATAFESALSRLSKAGAVLEDVAMPSVGDVMQLSPSLFTSEAYAQWGDVIEDRGALMFPEIRQRFESGRDHSAVDYLKAQKAMYRHRQRFAAQTAGYDAILIPSACIMPPNLERLKRDGAYFKDVNLKALRNTRIGNLMGLCALTLPTGVPSTGIMAMAAPFAEPRLLRIGAAMEPALRS